MKKNSRTLSLVVLAMVTAFFFVSIHPGVTLAKTSKMKAKTMTVMGTLEQEGSAYMIKSGKTTYTLEGKEDFTPMVGKKVKAWGTMKKNEKGHVLEVTKIEEVTK